MADTTVSRTEDSQNLFVVSGSGESTPITAITDCRTIISLSSNDEYSDFLDNASTDSCTSAKQHKKMQTLQKQLEQGMTKFILLLITRPNYLTNYLIN